ncbi:MAG TPA: flagellar basal-body MS-ring/collar protein FliF, partial [Bryobacteraceae bacterium]|nr:flagellar basal-body MS-ring/collar protein FliF [Bryobacteraceae bacterium]
MDQVKRIVGTLSGRQLFTILLVAALVSGGIYGLTQWQREAGFRPLYTTLAPEDAALVVQRLKESGVAYRISANGTVISVPEERVAELRLDMAAAGLPKSGRIGFEIFDKTNLGMTDFAEHVNYRRALEGELERSVMALTEVEQARVHISFPQESVFQEARQPAKASVLLRLRGAAQLPETAIPAITHLISSAVEGLAPEAVSVLDMRGNLLNRAKRVSESDSGTSEAALEYRRTVEHDLTSKLDATLEPLVGSGRFRASVSADTDLTSGEQSEEHFDPTQSVMVTSQKTEDISSPSRTAGGIPGTASNLPDPAPAPVTVGGGSSRKTESVNYQSSRTVKRTVLPQGGIKRLSVSVLIDHEVHFEGEGAQAKRVLTAPPPERLKVIHDLAAAAVGLNTERGDQLIVESLPFESTVNLEPPGPASAPPAAPLTPLEQLKKNPKMLYGAAGGAAVLLAGLFFLVFKMMKKSPPPPAHQPESLPPAKTEPAAMPRLAGADTWAPSAVGAAPIPALAPARIEVLTNQIRD